ncbi:MAG: hypothetical protein MJZ32_02105 [Bacteroidaceae bacterium]|nr:hypothetical protein [Bacteroidaceae bacterium]
MRCPDLSFHNINLKVTSNGGGIDGFQGYDKVDHTLRFSNTTATIKDNSTSVRGAIRNFKSVSYTDCYYSGPSSESLKNNTYCNHKGEKLDFIRIFRGYGIFLNGVDVTNDNKDDVFKDGKVSYNSSTKTLNLKGVSYEGSYGFISVYNPITINLSGKNSFKPTSPTSALNIYANTKITGSSGATLSANTDKTFPGIAVDQADLTIKDCQVSVNSPNAAGVKGAWPVNYMDLPGTSTLTVDNASLLVSNSSSWGCIRDFKKVTMTGCYCERPSGATYDTSYGYFKNGESIVTGNLEICKGYGVIVGGIRVTKDNASNVMSGVSYDASSNTLKLNNAKVSTTHYGIVAYKDLNLNVSGTANSISSSELHGILAYGDLNIYGSDKSTSSMSLTTSGYNYAGIYMNKNGKKFNVKNTTLTARASSTKGYGIVGSKTVASIQNADVTAYGNSASIYDIKSLSMIGVEIITPANAVFTPGVGITVDGNAVAGKDVKIGVKEYDIYVGGTKLTSANYADLTGDGKIKYDPSTNTLTLTNASIATEGYGISAQTKQRLYINLVGTSYVVSQRSYALYHNNTNGITIQSSSNGTLNLSGSYVGSYQEGGNLTVKNCTVKVNGMQGKEGNNYNTITIENANVTSECSFGGAFKWIDNILLTKCYVSEPVGAVFDSGQGGYLSAGTICNKVVIKAGTAPTAIDGVTLDNDNAPAYDLRGVQVDKNYKGIVIKNGKKYMQK